MAKQPTVADMLALKGQRQITMLYVDTLDEAAAAAAAGIDMLSIHPAGLDPKDARGRRQLLRPGPSADGQLCAYEDYLRATHAAMPVGGGLLPQLLVIFS